MTEQTTEEKLKEAEENYKALKAQAAEEKKFRKDNRVKLNAEKDEKLEAINHKLQAIQKAIYTYNRLGKRAKMVCNILDEIAEMATVEEESPAPEPEEKPEEAPEEG